MGISALLLDSERPARDCECERNTIPVDWDGKTVSGWSSFPSDRSERGPEPDVEVSQPVAAAENNTRVGLARSMASAGSRAYNGGLGAQPPERAQGAEPPVGDQGGQSPLKLMAF